VFRVLGSTVRIKVQADSSSRGWKDFICREEKRKAAWGQAGGSRNWWSQCVSEISIKLMTTFMK
jgi:hypothetical protein